MKPKKLLAGVVALAMLSNLGTSAFAEIGTTAETLGAYAQSAEPVATLSQGETYAVYPMALLSDEDFAKFDTIEVETAGSGSGCLSWKVKEGNNEQTVDSPTTPAGTVWSAQPAVSSDCPAVLINNNSPDGDVDIISVTLMDADQNPLLRIDADHLPETICTLGAGEEYVLDIYKILLYSGSKLDRRDIGYLNVRTCGSGSVVAKFRVSVPDPEGDFFYDLINQGPYAAGSACNIYVDLSYDDDTLWLCNDSKNSADEFGVYSIELCDGDRNPVVTLDASNIYLNSEAFFKKTIAANSEKYECVYIYPESILGDRISKVASVEVAAYANGVSKLCCCNGDFIIETGINSYPMTLTEGLSVLELVAYSKTLAVFKVAFKDAEGKVLAELDESNFDTLNVRGESKDNVLAELIEGESYAINTRALLGSFLSSLDSITVNAKGYGTLNVDWTNEDNNKSSYASPIGNNEFLIDGCCPLETHSEVLITSLGGYQSIESVLFSDKQGNPFCIIDATQAPPNTNTLDCTDLTRFEFVGIALDNLSDRESALVFDPMIIKKGCTISIECSALGEVTDDKPVILRLATGTEQQEEILTEIYYDKVTMDANNKVTARYSVPDKCVELFGENGLTLYGQNAVIHAVDIGLLPAPEELSAVYTDNGLKLSWQGSHCADCTYSVYRKYDNLWYKICDTANTELLLDQLEYSASNVFAVEAHHDALSSDMEEATLPFPYTLNAHNLKLGDDICVNFFADQTVHFVKEHTVEIRFNVNGRETVIPFDKAELTVNGSKFTCPVAAAEMNDIITGGFYVDGERWGDEFTYSVKEYADYILAHSEEYSWAVRVVKAMLNYGAAAEKYFTGGTQMEFTKPEVSADDLAQYDFTVTDNDSEIDYDGQVISLKNKVTAKLYFSGKEFATGDFTVKQNGKAVASSRLAIGSDANGTYLAVSDISANEMGDAFEVTVGGVTIANYSVFSYVLATLDSENEALSDVVAALYEYGCAAKAYAEVG